MLKVPYYYIAKLLNFKKQTKNLKIRQSLLGFTLIELLIVITLFGLSASLITASYLTFERNNRIRTGALNLKNDLRLAQSNALSGNKGINPNNCEDNQPLIGWYIKTVVGSGGYTFSGVCVPSTHKYIPVDQVLPLPENKNFPEGVTIQSYQIDVGVLQETFGKEVTIIYKPLTNKAAFYTGDADVLDFSDADFLASSEEPGDELTIILVGSQGTTHQVKINSASGEVNEKK